jgi:hypothetical protein
MWYLSLEESLLHLEPSLESLTSKESRKRLFALTSHFPDSLSSSFGFESRLWSAAGDVDFALHVTADKREVLAGLDSKSAFARTFGENPAWQRVLQFSRQWADPSSELHYLVADRRRSSLLALRYSYSINSSALSRIDVGTSRPSALAVFILSTVSYSDRTLRAARRRFP